MVSLWQFFGLPDPEGNKPPTKKKRSERHQPVQQTSAEPPLDVDLLDIPPPVTQAVPMGTAQQRRTIPFDWKGPVTSDGEPFHDLGIRMTYQHPIPDKAVRYVSPDEKFRIPFPEMFERVMQGDSIILDLRPLLHMQTHQDALKRELKSRSGHYGIGVYALDQYDKLFLIPGKDVVVEAKKYELGLTPQLTPSSML
jgi:hypothetical protein